MMRIGYLSTAYHTSHLLRETGILKAEWRLFGTGPAIVKAFENGEIDLAYIGLPPAIVGIDRGIEIKCVAGGHVEGTVIAGKETFRSSKETGEEMAFEQLNGKKIGVPSRGSIHDVILRKKLEDYGVDAEVINYPWADMILLDYEMGDLDAVCGTPNLAVLVMSAGGKIIIPPSELMPYNPSYGIVVTLEMVEREDELKDFVVKHEWACHMMREHPSWVAGIVEMGYDGFLERKTIKDILRLSPKYCASLPPEYIDATLEFGEILYSLGYINRKPEKEDVFDTGIVEALHPEEHHYF